MKAVQYVKRLLGILPREQVLEDHQITRTEILEVTIPMYKQASEMFRASKFKDPSVLLFVKNYNSLVARGPMVPNIHDNLKNVLENLDRLAEEFKLKIDDDVASAGLTHYRANLLQLLESGAFISKYARALINYIYVAETAANDGSTIDLSITPKEIAFVKDQFTSFCHVFRIMSGQTQHLIDQLNKIPEATVDDHTESMLAATQGGKVDPFQMGFIATPLNPAYFIGMLIADYQALRYKKAREDLKLAKLRKLNLERIQKNEPDAQLQAEIDKLEARIQEIEAKIADMEAKYLGGK